MGTRPTILLLIICVLCIQTSVCHAETQAERQVHRLNKIARVLIDLKRSSLMRQYRCTKSTRFSFETESELQSVREILLATIQSITGKNNEFSEEVIESWLFTADLGSRWHVEADGEVKSDLAASNVELAGIADAVVQQTLNKVLAKAPEDESGPKLELSAVPMTDAFGLVRMTFKASQASGVRFNPKSVEIKVGGTELKLGRDFFVQVLPGTPAGEAKLQIIVVSLPGEEFSLKMYATDPYGRNEVWRKGALKLKATTAKSGNIIPIIVGLENTAVVKGKLGQIINLANLGLGWKWEGKEHARAIVLPINSNSSMPVELGSENFLALVIPGFSGGKLTIGEREALIEPGFAADGAIKITNVNRFHSTNLLEQNSEYQDFATYLAIHQRVNQLYVMGLFHRKPKQLLDKISVEALADIQSILASRIEGGVQLTMEEGTGKEVVQFLQGLPGSTPILGEKLQGALNQLQSLPLLLTQKSSELKGIEIPNVGASRQLLGEVLKEVSFPKIEVPKNSKITLDDLRKVTHGTDVLVFADAKSGTIIMEYKLSPPAKEVESEWSYDWADEKNGQAALNLYGQCAVRASVEGRIQLAYDTRTKLFSIRALGPVTEGFSGGLKFKALVQPSVSHSKVSFGLIAAEAQVPPKGQKKVELSWTSDLMLNNGHPLTIGDLNTEQLNKLPLSCTDMSISATNNQIPVGIKMLVGNEIIDTLIRLQYKKLHDLLIEEQDSADEQESAVGSGFVLRPTVSPVGLIDFQGPSTPTLQYLSRFSCASLPGMFAAVSRSVDRALQRAPKSIPSTDGLSWHRAVRLGEEFTSRFESLATDTLEFHLLALDEAEKLEIDGQDISLAYPKGQNNEVNAEFVEYFNGLLSDRLAAKFPELPSMHDAVQVRRYGIGPDAKVCICLRRSSVRQFKINGQIYLVSARPSLNELDRFFDDSVELKLIPNEKRISVALNDFPYQSAAIRARIGRVASSSGIRDVSLDGNLICTASAKVPKIELSWSLLPLGQELQKTPLEPETKLKELPDKWLVRNKDKLEAVQQKVRKIGKDSQSEAKVLVTLSNGTSVPIVLLRKSENILDLSLQEVYQRIQDGINKSVGISNEGDILGKSKTKKGWYFSEISIFNIDADRTDILQRRVGLVFVDPTHVKQLTPKVMLQQKKDASNSVSGNRQSRFEISIFRDENGEINRLGAQLAEALGLLAADTLNAGELKTGALHGESMLSYVTLNPIKFEAKSKVELQGNLDGNLNLGPLNFKMTGKGKGSLNLSASVEVINKEQTLSTLGANEPVINISGKGDISVDAKASASESASRLLTPELDAKAVLRFDNSEVSIELEGLSDNQKQLGKVSLIGLHDGVVLADLASWNPALTHTHFQTRNVSSAARVSKFKIQGKDIQFCSPETPLRTVGNVRQWLEDVTNGSITLRYLPDGTKCELVRYKIGSPRVQSIKGEPDSRVPEVTYDSLFAALGFTDKTALDTYFADNDSVRLVATEPVFEATLLMGLSQALLQVHDAEQKLNRTRVGTSLAWLEYGRVSILLEKFMSGLRASRVGTFGELNEWLSREKSHFVITERNQSPWQLRFGKEYENIEIQFVWNNSSTHTLGFTLPKIENGPLKGVGLSLIAADPSSKRKLEADLHLQTTVAFGIDLERLAANGSESRCVYLLSGDPGRGPISRLATIDPKRGISMPSQFETSITGRMVLSAKNIVLQSAYKQVLLRLGKVDAEFENLHAYFQLPDDGDNDGRVYLPLPGTLESKINTGGKIRLDVGELSIPSLLLNKKLNVDFPRLDITTLQDSVRNWVMRLEIPDLSGKPLDLEALGYSSDRLIAELRNRLERELNGLKLPVFGGRMNVSLDVLDELESAFGQLGKVPDGQGVEQYLKNALGDWQDKEFKIPNEEGMFRLDLVKELDKRQIPLDLALDGLGLDFSQASVSLFTELRIRGRLKVTNNSVTLATFRDGNGNPAWPKITLTIVAKLSDSLGQARMGPVNLLVSKAKHPLFKCSAIDVEEVAKFTILCTLAGSGPPEDKSTVDFDDVIVRLLPEVQGGVNLGLQLVAQPGNKNLPRVRSGFGIVWCLEKCKLSEVADSMDDLRVGFANVELNVGDVATKVLRPAVDKLDDVAKPVKELTDKLKQPLPGIGALAGNLSLLDLIVLFCEDQKQRESVVKLIDAVAKISALSDKVTRLAGQEWVPIQELTGAASNLSFEISGADARNGARFGSISFRPSDIEPLETDWRHKKLSRAEVEELSTSMGETEISIPILDRPENALRLLLGQDITLVGIRLPEMEFRFEYSQFFPIIGPVGARFGGEAGGKVNLGFGFDTYGLRNPDADFYEGFYVSDTEGFDGYGADIPEVTLTAGIFGAAEINIVVARAGAGGGVYIDVTFNLHDDNGDGKVRFAELERNWKLGPIHIFDVGGRIYGKVFAYYEIGFRAFGKFVRIAGGEYSAETTLASFQLPRPVVPDKELPKFFKESNSVLSLDSNAVKRVEVWVRGAQYFATAVNHNNETRKEPEVFNNIKEIRLDGDERENVFIIGRIDGPVNIPVTISAGAGDDTVIVIGEGRTVLYGGPGKDKLTGGSGPNIIYGGPDADVIIGGRREDKLFGDAKNSTHPRVDDNPPGNDVIRGGDGDDTIYGGGGRDELYGDSGEDEIFGGDESDKIMGGRDDDRLFGENGADTLTGDHGDDIIVGGDGRDQIQGNEGNDLLVGPEVKHEVFVKIEVVKKLFSDNPNAEIPSELGLRLVNSSDLIEGGVGADYLVGGDSSDTLAGNEGADRIFAGGGADTVTGGSGFDRIWGGSGNDKLYGNDDSDQIVGGLGSDEVFAGDSANDESNDLDHQLWGDLAYSKDSPAVPKTRFNNRIYAKGLGGHLIVAGDGNNIIVSGKEKNGETDRPDDITCGDGDDSITIPSGHNIIRAGWGKNNIKTGDGDDVIFAGVDLFGGGDTFVPQARQSTNRFNFDWHQLESRGSSRNVIQAGNGKNIVGTGKGDDLVETGDDADVVFTHEGNDVVVTAKGQDILVLGAGDDRGNGGEGNDLIIGEQGKDILNGGSGRDCIWGGSPNAEIAEWITSATNTNSFAWFESSFLGRGNTNPLRLPSNLLRLDATEFSKVARDGLDTNLTWSNTELSNSLRIVPTRVNPDVNPHLPRQRDYLDRMHSVSGENDTGDQGDILDGGDNTDWLFGGMGKDILYGGNGHDYLDGGVDSDQLYGDSSNPEDEVGGNDVILGGANNDTLRGGAGIDQLYGGDGEDLLFGDAHDVGGQRLWGEAGSDKLHAYSAEIPDFIADAKWIKETQKVGDTLVGGDGPDYLYGGLRKDLLIGDTLGEVSGGESDFLHGDYLAGPRYIRNIHAGWAGGNDILFGDQGSDQLYGGGGSDKLYGGEDNDWLEGMDGSDSLFGGSSPDMLVVDVDSRYSTLGGDYHDGHGMNRWLGDSQDDAVDILVIMGDRTYHKDWRKNATVRTVSKLARFDNITVRTSDDSGNLTINYSAELGPDEAPSSTEYAREGEKGEFNVIWRLKKTNGPTESWEPLIEQIQILGLEKDDTLRLDITDKNLAFLTNPPTKIDQDRPNKASVMARPWVGVISGGPGNDILYGCNGRDRLDGGPGNDVIYGNGGDDRIAGDFSKSGSRQQVDVLFAGRGNDDLFGGPGTNYLFAWSRFPVDPANTSNRILMELSRNAGLTNNQQASFSPATPGSDYFPIWSNVLEAEAREPDSEKVPETDKSKSRYFGISDPRIVSTGGKQVPEDTGINRMLGSGNPVKSDYMYGGTGIDLLFGNGGPDFLFTRRGETFESKTGSDGQQWKEYARTTDRVWYVGGSDGPDEISIDFVTNPRNALFGRHIANFKTRGYYEPLISGFDGLTASGASGKPLHDKVARVRLVQSEIADVKDISDGVVYALDKTPIKGSPQDRSNSRLVRMFETTKGRFDFIHSEQTVDHISAIHRQTGDLDTQILAIVIDSAGDNDRIRVGETVQKSVWVDAGLGDDLVTIDPQRSYLPDRTEHTVDRQLLDPRLHRNDFPKLKSEQVKDWEGRERTIESRPYKIDASKSRILRNLTIDSARNEDPDHDWFILDAGINLFGPNDRILVNSPEGEKFTVRVFKTEEDAEGNLNSIIPQEVDGSVDLAEAVGKAHVYLQVFQPESKPTIYDIEIKRSNEKDVTETDDKNEVYLLGMITGNTRVKGLNLHSQDDVDRLRFKLPAGLTRCEISVSSTGSKPDFKIEPDDEGLQKDWLFQDEILIRQHRYSEREYTLNISGNAESRYQVQFKTDGTLQANRSVKAQELTTDLELPKSLNAQEVAKLKATIKDVKELLSKAEATSEDISNTKLRVKFTQKTKIDEALNVIADKQVVFSLDLEMTKLTDDSLAKIASLSHLSELNLSNCENITDESINLLRGLSSLTSLSLAGTKITNVGLESISSMTKLNSLNLAACTGISDTGLLSLQKLKKLVSLNTQQAPGITDRGRELLLDRLPTLTILEWANKTPSEKTPFSFYAESATALSLLSHFSAGDSEERKGGNKYGWTNGKTEEKNKAEAEAHGLAAKLRGPWGVKESNNEFHVRSFETKPHWYSINTAQVVDGESIVVRLEDNRLLDQVRLVVNIYAKGDVSSLFQATSDPLNNSVEIAVRKGKRNMVRLVAATPPLIDAGEIERVSKLKLKLPNKLEPSIIKLTKDLANDSAQVRLSQRRVMNTQKLREMLEEALKLAVPDRNPSVVIDTSKLVIQLESKEQEHPNDFRLEGAELFGFGSNDLAGSEIEQVKGQAITALPSNDLLIGVYIETSDQLSEDIPYSISMKSWNPEPRIEDLSATGSVALAEPNNNASLVEDMWDYFNFPVPVRRDAIFGGPGNDRLLGGSGEDWIFGGPNNDVLCGGRDRQASDVLFGGDGDDLFQIVTDNWPILPSTGRPGDPANADQFDGGPGWDRVLYLGHDATPENQTDLTKHLGRDYVMLGYDQFLGRYRVANVPWLTRTNQAGHFAGTKGDPLMVWYAYYQAQNIEGTLVDTRGGMDIVHAEPGFYFKPIRQSWGIGRGDVQAGASAFKNLEIRGGDGADLLFGSAGSDTVYGEGGTDIIWGGLGDDRLLGGPDDDFLIGGPTTSHRINRVDRKELLKSLLIEGKTKWKVSRLDQAAFVENEERQVRDAIQELKKLKPNERSNKLNPLVQKYEHLEAYESLLQLLTENTPEESRDQSTQVISDNLVGEAQNFSHAWPSTVERPGREFARLKLGRDVTTNIELSTAPILRSKNNENDKQPIWRISNIGDFSGDGVDDFLVSGRPIDNSYVLFGPIIPNHLFNVSADGSHNENTAGKDIRVQSEHWSFDVPVGATKELSPMLSQFDISGVADVELNSDLGVPIHGRADINSDGASDLVFIQSNHENESTIRFVLSGRSIPREISANASQLKSNVFPIEHSLNALDARANPASDKPRLLPNVQLGRFVRQNEGVQILLARKENNPGKRIAVVIHVALNGASVVQIINGDTDLIGSNQNDSDKKKKEWADSFGIAIKANNITARHPKVSSQLTVANIGDTNGDGLDEIAITNPRFVEAKQGMDKFQPVGRCYLVFNYPQERGEVSLTANVSQIHVWESVGLGTGIYPLGDVNDDGLADFAFTGNPLKFAGKKNIRWPAYIMRGRSSYEKQLYRLTNRGESDGKYFFGTEDIVLDIDDEVDAESLTLKAANVDGDDQFDLITTYMQKEDLVVSIRSGVFYPMRRRLVPDTKEKEVKLAQNTSPFVLSYRKKGLHRIRMINGIGSARLLIPQSSDLKSAKIPKLDPIAVTNLGNYSLDDLAIPTNAGLALLFSEARKVDIDFSGAEWLANHEVPGLGIFLKEQANGEAYSSPIGKFEGNPNRLPPDKICKNLQPIGNVNDPSSVFYGPIQYLKPSSAKVNVPHSSIVASTVICDYLAEADSIIRFGDAGTLTIHKNGTGELKLTEERLLSVHEAGTRFQLRFLIESQQISAWVAQVGPSMETRFRPLFSSIRADAFTTVSIESDDLKELHEIRSMIAAKWHRFQLAGDGQVGDQISIHTRSEGEGAGFPVSTPGRSFEILLKEGRQKAEKPNLQIRPGIPVMEEDRFGLKQFNRWHQLMTIAAGEQDGRKNIISINKRPASIRRYVDISALLPIVEDPELHIESADFEVNVQAGAKTNSVKLSLSATGKTMPSLQLSEMRENSEIYHTDETILRKQLVEFLREGITQLMLTVTIDSGSTDFGVKFKVRVRNQPGLRVSGYAIKSNSKEAKATLVFHDKSIVDLRNLPAGEYFLRVYDPFVDVENRLFEANYSREKAIEYRVKIEAPKIGEADPVTDVDTIFGEAGDDIIIGNSGADRIFGGFGADYFVAEKSEIRDLNRNNAGFLKTLTEVVTRPRTSESFHQSLPVEDPILHDSYFEDLGPSRLGLKQLLAHQLGLTFESGTSSGPFWRLKRPLRASDLTSLIQLDLTPLRGPWNADTFVGSKENADKKIILTIRDANGIPKKLEKEITIQKVEEYHRNSGYASLRGMEYATNLEVLAARYMHIYDDTNSKEPIREAHLQPLRPGIRPGREWHGELGCRRLRMVNLDHNPLPKATLEILSELQDLEYLSATESSGISSGRIEDASELRKLTQLKWLDISGEVSGAVSVTDIAHLPSDPTKFIRWDGKKFINVETGENQNVKGADDAKKGEEIWGKITKVDWLSYPSLKSDADASSWLGDFKRLTHLRVANRHVMDRHLSFIANGSRGKAGVLQTLDIRNNHVTDISQLAGIHVLDDEDVRRRKTQGLLQSWRSDSTPQGTMILNPPDYDGDQWVVSHDPQSVGGTYRMIEASKRNASIKFTFKGVVPGKYRLALSWPSGIETLTETATFKVKGKMSLLNQRAVDWEPLLGTSFWYAPENCTIEVSQDSDSQDITAILEANTGVLAIDAVALVRQEFLDDLRRIDLSASDQIDSGQLNPLNNLSHAVAAPYLTQREKSVATLSLPHSAAKPPRVEALDPSGLSPVLLAPREVLQIPIKLISPEKPQTPVSNNSSAMSKQSLIVHSKDGLVSLRCEVLRARNDDLVSDFDEGRWGLECLLSSGTEKPKEVLNQYQEIRDDSKLVLKANKEFLGPVFLRITIRSKSGRSCQQLIEVASGVTTLNVKTVPNFEKKDKEP